MRLSNPETTQDAALQDRVIEQANEIALQLKFGGEYHCYTSNGSATRWSVCKRNGNTERYTVSIVDLTANTCECPFYAKEKYCKHLLALNAVLDEEAPEAAQCEE